MRKQKSRPRSRQSAGSPRWLPLALMAGGAALLAVMAWLAWPRPAAPLAPIEVNGAPKLKIEPASVDLGDVPLGQTVAASFTLTNVGDQPLRFGAAPYIEVVAGCWPPVPTIGAMVLQPGERTTLAMEFVMHGDMDGPHNFLVHMPTTDPARPDVGLTVLSNWVP